MSNLVVIGFMLLVFGGMMAIGRLEKRDRDRWLAVRRSYGRNMVFPSKDADWQRFANCIGEWLDIPPHSIFPEDSFEELIEGGLDTNEFLELLSTEFGVKARRQDLFWTTCLTYGMPGEERSLREILDVMLSKRSGMVRVAVVADSSTNTDES